LKWVHAFLKWVHAGGSRRRHALSSGSRRRHALSSVPLLCLFFFTGRDGAAMQALGMAQQPAAVAGMQGFMNQMQAAFGLAQVCSRGVYPV
jgi:hypothetical protein